MILPSCIIHASARISTVGIAGSTGSSGLVLRRPLLGNWFLSAIFLILSIFTSGISAQDVSCALPTEVLRQERVRAADRFIRLQAASGQARNLTAQLQGLEETFGQSAVFKSSVFDTMVGPYSVFFTFQFFDPEMNGGYLSSSAPVFLNTSWDRNALVVSVREAFTAMTTGDSANFTSSWRFEFFNCSDIIARAEESGLDKALGFVFNNTPQSLDAVTICSLVNDACPGSLFPFPSVLDCLIYMDSIPLKCASDSAATMTGDTLACRLRWAVIARLDPMGSCSLVSADSAACVEEACFIEGSLTKYPLSASSNVNSSLYGSVPILVVSFLVAFVPAFTYLYLIISGFSRIRRWSRADLGLSVSDSKARAGRDLQQQKKKQPTFVRATFGLAARNLVLEIPQRTLLQPMSFYFSPGSFVGIMGASGAGKSSLLRLISGKSPKGAKQIGDLLLVRRNDMAVPLSTSGEPIGYVEQHVGDLAGAHPELTVQESLMCHALMVIGLSLPLNRDVGHDDEQRTTEMVRDVVIAMGLERFLHRKMRFLSGGEQKRWRLARELLERPSMLLVDEATSGLDSEAALELTRSLKDLTLKGVTTIMTVHQPRNTILDLLDTVLVLSFGGRVAVLGHCPLLRSRLAGLQADYLSYIEEISSSGGEGGWMEKAAAEYLVSAFWRQDSKMEGRVCVEQPHNGSEHVDGGDDCHDGMSLNQVLMYIKEAWMRTAGSHGNAHNTFVPLDPATVLDVMRELALPESPHGDGMESLRATMAILVSEIEWMLEEGHKGLPPLLAGDSMGDTLTALCEHRRPVSLLLPSRSAVRKKVESLVVDHQTKYFSGDRMGGKFFSSMLQRFKQAITIQQVLTKVILSTISPSDHFMYLTLALITSLFICLVFPQLKYTNLVEIQVFVSSLLLISLSGIAVASSIFRKDVENLRSYINLSGEVDRSLGRYSPLVILNLVLKMYLGCFILSILMVIPFVFIIGWNVGSFEHFAEYFLSFNQFLVVCSMAYLLLAIYIPVKDTFFALFTGWNIYFSGALVLFNDCFLIWKYWAFYITPAYHLTNSWMWTQFFNNSMECGSRADPDICPATGTFTLNVFGFQAISSGASILILIGMNILFSLLLAFISLYRQPICALN